MVMLVGGGMLETKVLKEMREKMVKNFMGVLVLAELKKRSMSGYDIIGFVHDKFNLLVSSGTVYSLLYSMERKGLVEGQKNNRKRVYKLTDEGKETIKTILNANDEIRSFLMNLLKIGQRFP